MSTKAHARFSSVASSDTGAHLLRVAVVDDDESARLCYQDILRSSGNFSLAGSFSNATEALQIIPRLQPHLTLMDIRLPDLNGIECTKRLILAMPYLKIVIHRLYLSTLLTDESHTISITKASSWIDELCVVVVKGDRHLWTTECPSANDMPHPPP